MHEALTIYQLHVEHTLCHGGTIDAQRVENQYDVVYKVDMYLYSPVLWDNIVHTMNAAVYRVQTHAASNVYILIFVWIEREYIDRTLMYDHDMLQDVHPLRENHREHLVDSVIGLLFLYHFWRHTLYCVYHHKVSNVSCIHNTRDSTSRLVVQTISSS